MSGGFGRKGVVPGETVAPSFGQAQRLVQRTLSKPDDTLSPAARAFIAAERARADAHKDASTGQARVAPMSTFESAALLQPCARKPAKSLVLAYVYWWFSGPIGAHRFYLGAYRSGAAMAGLFFGGLVVMLAVPFVGVAMICGCIGWTFLDAFLIPGLRRRLAASAPRQDLAHVFA